MTRAEYLPFERGLKDGLFLYWQRMKTFLTVMAASALVLGTVASFFVPSEPQSHDLRDVYNHPEFPIRIIILSSVACAAFAVLVRRLSSFTLGVGYRKFSLLWHMLLVLALTAGTMTLFWGYHWDVIFPAAATALASLFDEVVHYRHERAVERRHRSTERNK
jgi:hypothetical protein